MGAHMIVNIQPKDNITPSTDWLVFVSEAYENTEETIALF